MSIAPAHLQSPEALSPYLEGTHIQYAWDSTSLGLFKTCPRLYYYTMIEGWVPKDESIHLRFGIEYHQALQEYDVMRASDSEATHEEVLRQTVLNLYARTYDWETDPDSKAGRYKNRQTLLSLVIDYLDKFRDDPAKTLILDDGRPAVELSFRFELDWAPRALDSQPYVISGHLDRVVDFQDSLFGMDRKTTTTTLSSYYFNQFQPNNQMTLYTLATKVILNTPVRGIIIDAAQILLEKPNAFQRDFTYRTQDQLDEWIEDLGYHLSIAESYATADYWPQNDTACDKYGGCRFRDICSKSPGVRDQFLKSNFHKLEEDKRWNPLRSR